MRVKVSSEIKAPIEKVWATISQLDKEPEFWYGTRSVKDLKREGNIVWREKVQMFRSSVEKKRVTLYPAENKVVMRNWRGS